MRINKKIISGILATLTACTLISCSKNISNDILPSEPENITTQNTLTDPPPAEIKFGFKLNSGAKKAKYDLKAGINKEEKVDLREFCSPIGNQGSLGSCTAFAMGRGLREFLMIRDKKPLVPLSPLFLYYNERKIDGTINEDAGSTMATGMKALKETGDCPETLWSYNTWKFKKEPPKEAYESGVQYEISDAKNLDGLQAIKDELAKKNPVVFGFYVYSSFMNSSHGIIPVPDIKTEKLMGGHAVMAVGYDDAKNVLIMRNSWGKGWGDQGYFYMPYEYFKLALVEDVWTGSAVTAKKRKR